MFWGSVVKQNAKVDASDSVSGILHISNAQLGESSEG